MAPSPFRTTAVVCGIVTASLSVGLLTPAVATAATTTPTAASSSDSTAQEDAPDFDALPVDPSLTAPTFHQDWSTPFGSRILAGDAGGDDLWLVLGDTVYDRSTGGGAFFITVQNRLQDAGLEVIRVHTAADGTQTRGERIPIPRTIKIDGLQQQNTFTPGTTHFAGSATAGATVVAKDTTSGATLFTTEVSGARNGTGTWDADAHLTASDHVITLTQTTTDGRTNELRDVRFSPAASDAPQAPTVAQKGRVLDGSFVVAGSVAKDVDSVVVQDEAGTTIADADLGETGYAARLPQDRVGSTVYVVGRTADGTSSARVPVALEQLPVDPAAAAPSLRSVFVHPDGRIQVVGEHDDAPGLWILDGDRVVGHATSADAVWSYTIAAAATGKQLDMVNLVFDGRDFSGTSERVHLPRLLQVDGIADDNTYEPGARAFSGKAEAGATITATDQDGHQLFRTEATGSRSGVGTWKADADLTARDGYQITFTQTTADGRTSVMRDIAFDAGTTKPFAVTSPDAGSDQKGKQVTFTGTGTPGDTVTLHVSNFASADVTTTVRDDGTWTTSRYLGTGAYTFDVTQTNTAGTTTGEVTGFRLNQAPVTKPFAVTSPDAGSDQKGKQVTFTGTGTPGDTVTLHVSNFASADVTTTVRDDGTWTTSRYLGTGAYTFDVTQTNTAGTTTGEVTGFRLNQAPASADQPFAVTGPTTGSTFTPNTVLEFSGTGPVGARIDIDPGAGLAPVETVVGPTGAWKVGKYVGNGGYRFTVTMTPVTGTPEVSDPIVVTPTR
ncbi:hypothetical protein [Curtobacterium sp. SL109]|uniref:hypothetical protein n=1 Tax=Curtobacterium sp. SL109 TaxID=2994662 RepID=UPI002273DC0D|nr:hypothetical protein [Curtobacterium sp. SL109]MCY1694055.1 hypothetical protein [Curtobacterium sp. SL109]